MPKVIVCGAGIGGLTAAHELAKHGFQVTVYERNAELGGLARSRTLKHRGKAYPTEYSWRIYGVDYRNLFRILHEIPLREDASKSVYDRLVHVNDYIFPRIGASEAVLSRGDHAEALVGRIGYWELLKSLDIVFRCRTMSTARMDSMDRMKWKDICKHLSPEAKKFMVRMWGPVLGMDPDQMGFPVIARSVQIIIDALLGKVSGLYLMDRPTNEGWFDEWAAYLTTSYGVTFRTETEVEDMLVTNGRVSGVRFRDKRSGETTTDATDYVACGLPVEVVASMVGRNAVLASHDGFRGMSSLDRISKQVQLSVQLFLAEKLVYPAEGRIVLYLPDTPWALIIEPQDLVWGKTYCTDPRVKTVLSVGICQTNAPGLRHKKPFVECNEAEVEQEVWEQIVRSLEHSIIRTESGTPVDQVEIVLFYMWDSFRFDPKAKRIVIWEPKFNNNAGALAFQPNVRTGIPNLLFSTAYTKTDRFSYSMEAAAEAGTRAANAILEMENANGASYEPSVVFPFQIASRTLRPLVVLDRGLFRLGMPHASTATFGSSLALIALYALIVTTLIAVSIWWIV